MHSRSGAIERWWPTTQSLDLVEGTVELVAEAVRAEFTELTRGEALESSWKRFPDLDAAFSAAPSFANVATFCLVLPSHSTWSVLWNNSFLCSGYDSLCWCLTNNHGLTTFHWSAHDGLTSFQPGASFDYRRLVAGLPEERSVYCGQNDKSWVFHQSGHAMPEEDVKLYSANRIKDRLNERHMADLLARLGAFPWSEKFYALSERPCFVVERTQIPATVILRTREEVIGAP